MERDDALPEALVYRGTSSIGGSPRTVRLSLEAVIDGRRLYLVIERSMPRRWIDESRFVAECDRSFAGQGFFTANKEGGSHLYFDGTVIVRADCGDVRRSLVGPSNVSGARRPRQSAKLDRPG